MLFSCILIAFDVQDKLSRFDFLIVFIGIILGLSVGHFVSFLGRILAIEKPPKIEAPHAVYLVILFLTQVHYWWTLWDARLIESLDYFSYIYLLALPMLLYLATSILCPISENGVTLKNWSFVKYSSRFYVVFECILLVGMLQGIFIWDQPVLNSALRGIAAIVLVPAFFTSEKKVHFSISLFMLCSFFVYIIYCSNLASPRC